MEILQVEMDRKLPERRVEENKKAITRAKFHRQMLVKPAPHQPACLMARYIAIRSSRQLATYPSGFPFGTLTDFADLIGRQGNDNPGLRIECHVTDDTGLLEIGTLAANQKIPATLVKGASSGLIRNTQASHQVRLDRTLGRGLVCAW